MSVHYWHVGTWFPINKQKQTIQPKYTYSVFAWFQRNRQSIKWTDWKVPVLHPPPGQVPVDVWIKVVCNIVLSQKNDCTSSVLNINGFLQLCESKGASCEQRPDSFINCVHLLLRQFACSWVYNHSWAVHSLKLCTTDRQPLFWCLALTDKTLKIGTTDRQPLCWKHSEDRYNWQTTSVLMPCSC